MRKVLFISIDTFRKDNLTKRFQGVECAPFLKSIREQSTYYVNYSASCNWTIPSYASMFTGEPTIRHNFWSYKEYPAEPVPLVFDKLADNGVRAGIMHSRGPLGQRIFNYNRQKYLSVGHEPHDLAKSMNMVMKHLEDMDFLFCHTFLQHDYLFHRKIKANPFGIRRPYRFIGRAGSWWMARKFVNWSRTPKDKRRPMSQKDISMLERMYYNECMLTDAYMRELFERVLEKYPDTLIVVNSDHGECFNRCKKVIRRPQDGGFTGNLLWGHGSGQCYEQFDVLLMVHDALLPTSKVVNTRIDHEDIHDMVLSFFGLCDFPAGDKERHFMSTGFDFVGNCGIREEDDFYVYHREGGRSLRYLMCDNLFSDDMKEITDEQEDGYRRMLLERLEVGSESREADEETMKQLRALGYMD
jgi:membrane-anchored protein YejM (alkaline phosphatase superfamily)